MNRKYDLAFFEHKLEEIRAIRPNISITTDIIVGFPGENEDDFKETVENAKKFNFSKIHVFPYSERLGTKAMELDGHLDSTVKKARARELLLVSKELEKRYARKSLNQELEVLFEEVKDGLSIGHTSNYLKVKVKGEIKPNTICLVRVKAYLIDSLIGEAICQR